MPLSDAVQLPLVHMWMAVRIVDICVSAIIAVGTDIVQNARANNGSGGSTPGKRSYCQFPIFTWCSRYRIPLIHFVCIREKQFTIRCFKLPGVYYRSEEHTSELQS